MAPLQKTVFLLLRYCGDPTKRESINVGIVALPAEANGTAGLAEVRFTHNWRRLRCFDPLVDLEEVQAIEREIRQDLQDPLRQAELLKRAGDAYANNIRVDVLKGCLTEAPAKEIEKLGSLYLETPSSANERELTGRQRILHVMSDEMQKAGVLELIRSDIAEAEFTEPGNPFRLDFGYAVRNDVKFLHAVSLAQRVESGMTLAARFRALAAGVQKKRGGKAWLTAVVDDNLPKDGEVDFTLGVMRESGIVVAPAAETPRIAERARLELKLSF